MDKNRPYRPVRWFITWFALSTGFFSLAILIYDQAVKHLEWSDSMHEYLLVAVAVYLPVSTMLIFAVVCARGGWIARGMLVIATMTAFYAVGHEHPGIDLLGLLWLLVGFPVLVVGMLGKLGNALGYQTFAEVESLKSEPGVGFQINEGTSDYDVLQNHRIFELSDAMVKGTYEYYLYGMNNREED